MKKQSFFTKILALSLAMMVLFGALPVSAADVVEPSIQPEIPTEVVTEAPVVTETQGEVNPTEVASEVEVEPTESIAPTEPTESIAPTEPEATPSSNITLKCNLNSDFRKLNKRNIYNGISNIKFEILTEDKLTTADALFSEDENSTDYWGNKEGYSEKKYYTSTEENVEIAGKNYVKTRVVLDISASNGGDAITKSGTYYAKFAYKSSTDEEVKIETRKIIIDNDPPVCDGFSYGEPSNNAIAVTCNGISDACLVDAEVFAPDGTPKEHSNEGSSLTFEADQNGIYRVVLKDEFGASATYSTKSIDNIAPVIEEMTAENWSNGKKVTITAKITDEGGSGVDIGNFMFDDKPVALAESTSGQADIYTFTVEDLEEKEYVAEIKDGCGNTCEYNFDASKYVDTKAPSEEDFTVHFSLEESATDKILNLLAFGLYTNTPSLKMTVTVDKNEGSSIETVGFDNGSDDFIENTADENGTVEFTINFDESKTNEQQDISEYEFYAVDAVGNKSEKISLSETKITVTGNVADATTRENYEFIYSEAIPIINIVKNPGTTGVDTAEEVCIVKSDSGVEYTFNFQDDISGLDVSTAKLYYGVASDFTKKDNYYYPIKDQKPVVPNDEITGQPVTEKSTSHSLKYTPTGEEGKLYVLLAEVANNCGNTAYEQVLLAYDNSAPELTSTPDEAIVDKVKTVSFDVADLPEKYASGIGEIKVVDSNDKTVKVSTYDGLEPTVNDFSFEPVVNTNQEYFVSVTDNLGHILEKQSLGTFEYDTDAPKFSEFVYNNDNNEKWVNGDVIVSFEVTDNLSGVKAVEVLNSKNEDVTLSVSGNEYSFEATSYDEVYTIKAVDNAENDAFETVEKVKIDTTPPEITAVTIESIKNKKAELKILNMLTFGLYGSTGIKITIEAEDEYPSSDFESVVLTYDKEKVDYGVKIDYDEDNLISTATLEWKLPADKIYEAQNLCVTATDKAGISVSKALSILDDDDECIFKVDGDDDTKLEDDFEVIVSEVSPTINPVVLSANTNSDSPAKEYQVYDSASNAFIEYFSNENVTLEFNVTDKTTKIHSVNVMVNGNDVTGKCTFSNSFESTADHAFTNFENHKGLWVNEVDVELNIADVAEYVNKCEDGSADGTTGCNTIKIIATGNNGISGSKSATFFVDEQKPIITDFKFDGTGKNDFKENKDELANVAVTNYGYFFKEKTKVTVSASDFAGSGVNSIRLVCVPVDNTGVKNIEGFDETKSINVDGETTDSCSFNVDKGFKGQIYAYAIDNVANQGNAFFPDRLIIEKDEAHHNENSSVSAKIQQASKDAAVVKDMLLYGESSEVKVDIEICDYLSGLDEITYGVYHNNDALLEKKIEIPQVIVDASAFNKAVESCKNEGWTVTTDGDIVTEMSTTIVIDTDDKTYDYNNLTVRISGMDNCGYPIEQTSSEVFNIDTTDPKIEISYSDAVGNTYNDRTYYKDTRVATIVVRERNFDPDGFLNEIINTEGEKPVVVSEWQKTSSDDNNAEHTATVTFDKDGVFDVNFACFDMAKNSGEHDGEIFTIDTIDPVVSVTYDNNNASNGSYYAAGRTATITVEEHNFTADNAYLTYSPVATMSDNSTPMTPPSLSGWRSVGDTHTATITFNEDGKYEFTFDFKDLSLREVQQFKQEVFYVDTKIDGLKFNNVVNGKAYDGAVIPQIVFTDNNYSNATYTLKRISYDFANGVNGNDTVTTLVTNETITTTGKTVTYNNFPENESNDGIYLLSATIVDLAGNTKTEQITFSVNRFGSTFMLGNEDTEKLVENVYSKNPSDIVIVEINVNEVKDQSVSLSRNTKTVDLKNGKDFDIKSTGGSTSWYKYVYTIDKENFAEEGNYTITVTSVDEFNKTVSNRTAQSEQENKTRERNCPVSFVVDKTAPVISIEGVEDGEATRDASRNIKIMCLDTNIDKESLVVKLDGEELSADEYTLDDTLVGELSVDFTVKSDGTQAKHNVEVYVEDLADNGANDDISEFTIAATLLTLYLSNTGAIIATIAVLIAAAIIIILVVRKKRKEA